ncbi:O-antigen ligase family protein [Gordonia amicalis]|nr:O-antigen ligase family protein [Gordonia amicalis]
MLWFGCVVALILLQLIFGRLAYPRFSAVWIFSGYASVSAILTATNEASVSQNLFVGFQLLLMLGLCPFVMTYNARHRPSFVTKIAIAFIIGQTASSVVALFQLGGASVAGYQAVYGRAPGLAAHPNALGVLASLAIVICLVGVVRTASWQRIGFLVGLFANLAGLLATGSISALVSCSVGLAVVTLCMRDQLWAVLKWAATGLLATWIVAVVLNLSDRFQSPIDRYLQVSGQTDSQSSWEIRLRTYEFVWSAIGDHPFFGNGLAPQFGGTFNGTTVTHNLVLRAWFQGGFLLAAASVAILVAFMIVIVQSIMRKSDAASAGILITAGAFALTSAFFEQADYWLPVIVAWAALRSRDTEQFANGTRRPRRTPPRLSEERESKNGVTPTFSRIEDTAAVSLGDYVVD